MNFCLTTAGKEYMAKVNAGEMQMHLTRAVTGSGSSSSLEILTNVVDERQQIQLDEVKAQGEYTHITCVLTNLELNREYVLRQIGLYAMDNMGVEKLIIIGQDKYGDRIPILEEKEVEYQYNIGMRVSNAAEITFDFSVNDFLRKKYFYEHLEEYEKYKNAIQNQFMALPRVKVGEEKQLDRKDTILMELLKGTNRMYRMKRDSEDQKHEYELAAVFETALTRDDLQSGDTLATLFGKVSKFFADLKENSFKEADDPFVPMTVNTYKQPSSRTKGSSYGFITAQRGLLIVFFDRFIKGMEDPAVDKTGYGIESVKKTELGADDRPCKAVCNNVICIKEGQEVERQLGVKSGR